MRIDTLPKNQLKKNVPDIRTGQVIRVHERIKEGEKERTQIFEGLVIAVKHGKGLDGTFTVRKISAGVGVERIFPIHMPAIEKIEVLRRENVRRSKLYYVRDQVGQKVKKRKTKLQSFVFDMGGTAEEEVAEEEEPTEESAPKETNATKTEKKDEGTEKKGEEKKEEAKEETKDEEEAKEELKQEPKKEDKGEEKTE